MGAIPATAQACAAILDYGFVVTWGDDGFGGDSSAVQDQLKNVLEIQASRRAFAAILSDETLVSWGHPVFGGGSKVVQGELQNLCHTRAMSADRP